MTAPDRYSHLFRPPAHPRRRASDRLRLRLGERGAAIALVVILTMAGLMLLSAWRQATAAIDQRIAALRAAPLPAVTAAVAAAGPTTQRPEAAQAGSP